MKMYSVTRVLGRWNEFAENGIPTAILQDAQARGTEIHRCCTAIAGGESVIAERGDIEGYLISFRDWWEFHGLQILVAEARFEDGTFGFYGHPDIIAVGPDGMIWLIDMKSPQTEQPTWKGQMAAYKHLVEDTGDYKVGKVGTLILDKEGKSARFIKYDEQRRDFAVFLGALQAEREYTRKGGEENHG